MDPFRQNFFVSNDERRETVEFLISNRDAEGFFWIKAPSPIAIATHDSQRGETTNDSGHDKVT